MTSFEGNWHLMLPVDPVNMCFLTPHDWKRQDNSALQKSMSINPLGPTHPLNFPQCQGAWPSHVQGVYWGEFPRNTIGQVAWCSCPSERTSSVMEQFTKMNVRSAQNKKRLSVLQITAASFFWRSIFLLSRLSIASLHHTSSFHFSFHFLLFLWVHFCLVRLCEDPRG